MTQPNSLPQGEQEWLDSLFTLHLIISLVFYTAWGALLIWWPGAIAYSPPSNTHDGSPFWGSIFVLTGFLLFVTLLRPDVRGFRRFTIVWLFSLSGFVVLIAALSLPFAGTGWGWLLCWLFVLLRHVTATISVYRDPDMYNLPSIVAEVGGGFLYLPQRIAHRLKHLARFGQRKEPEEASSPVAHPHDN